VLLDGHGGDEVVSHAFVRLNELAHKRRWLELWMEVQGVSRLYGTNSIATYLELLSSFGPTLPLSRTRQRLARLRHRALGKADRGPSWRRMLNSDLMQRTELMQRYQVAARERQSTLTDEPRFHRWQVSSGLVAHAFQVLDKAAATAGIEPRYPFWDKDLLEFCLSLHPSEKLSNGWSRLVLRKAMQDILPPRIQWRTDKIDFRDNLVGGMLRNHEPLLDRTFGAEADRVAPYVDIPEMRAAYRRLQESPASVPMDDVLHVWRTTWLSQWLKQLERPGLSP
jgi:asparagine synthase (glutamine-hydrolysing)